MAMPLSALMGTASQPPALWPLCVPAPALPHQGPQLPAALRGLPRAPVPLARMVFIAGKPARRRQG
eukprot:5606135-Alexandrium_andersonii.AAC.1